MTHVLLVEDSPTQAEEIKFILESANFEVTLSRCAEDALRELKTRDFDVIVSDIIMPEMSGYDLCKIIKANRNKRHIPVILLTSLHDPMDIIHGLECGADNFITKPCNPDSLIRNVKGILENKRLRFENRLNLGIEIMFLGKRFTINSDKEQILDLLISTFEDIVQKNKELQKNQIELALAKTRLEDYTRKVEGQARVSEDKYRSLMQGARDAIFVASADGKILEINQQAEDLLGQKSTELIGHQCETLFDHAGQIFLIENLQKIQKTDKSGVTLTDICMIGSNAATVCVDISVSKIKTGDHSILLMIARDITDRKQLQQQLLHHEKMATVGTLAAGIAHEINNPIAIILENLNHLSKYNEHIKQDINEISLVENLSTDLIQSHIQSLHRKMKSHYAKLDVDQVITDSIQGGERIRDIVKDLKIFSHVSDTDAAIVNVNDRINETLRMAYPEIRHRARIEKQLATDLPDIIANSGKISQLFLNLIVNAAQSFEDENAERNVIYISTKNIKNHILIEISDTGNGIPKSIINKIFDPFFTTKSVGVGTGLGLSICYEIVQKHRGTIQVESEPGLGTKFSLTLPHDTGLTLPQREPVPPPPQLIKTKPRVLIVDDEPALLRAYQRMLTPDYEVEGALGGQAALEVLARTKKSFTFFDAILCDLMMPNVDGVDIYEYLIEHFDNFHSRIIFMSGGTVTKRTKDFLDEHPSHRVLSKPFKINDVQTAMLAVLKAAV